MKHVFSTNRRISPWAWIPTLYFVEGIPYFIVNNISIIMFARMGMSNGDIGMYTSLLYIPWVIKPLWSPFVDIIKTKRWWIVSTQVLMAVALAFIALAIPRPSAEEISSGMSVSPFIVSLIVFWVTAFASATHDIAADGYYMLALDTRSQSFFVGIRSTFYRLASVFGQGVLVYIAGVLEKTLGDIPAAWSVTLTVSSILLGVIAIYHTFVLPHPVNDAVRVPSGERYGKFLSIIRESGRTFYTFFKKKGIVLSLLFLLLYRLPEAFLVKMLNPFLLASAGQGGLGMSTDMVGIAYGTAGAAALIVGGILGGIAAAKWGLKKVIWPMAMSLALPCAVFVYLSMTQTDNIWVITSCICLDQLGYGFGFTAYMLYMIHFSEGEFKTSHYSLCTAFMALSMMLPGMVAGYLQEWLGYVNFFWMVMLCCMATLIVTFFVKSRLPR